MANPRIYKSIKEFYPHYLTEHQDPKSRVLHFMGTFLVLLILGGSIFLSNYSFMWLLPVVGYGFAWTGHFFFEKNKPATFQYPFYSLGSDFILFWHLLTGKEKFNPSK
jgi:hypothetical protein